MKGIQMISLKRRFSSWTMVLLIGFLFPSCLKEEIKDSKKIEDIMEFQERAWNEGDIPGFMEYYWASDELLFVGKKGVTHGHEATLNNYFESYPNPEAMGQLTFENIHIDILSPDNAFVVGKWTLHRVQDTLGGHYSLLWKKVNGKWRIVADHSS